MQWLSRSSASGGRLVIGEQPDLVAQQSSRRRVLSHPHGRFERKATEWLMDQNVAMARILRDALLRELTNAHGRTLGARPHNGARKGPTFLLEMFERRDRTKTLDLPMSRNDIADYLGLTIETVSRTLSALKRDGVIGIPSPHRIELLDRGALDAASET